MFLLTSTIWFIFTIFHNVVAGHNKILVSILAYHSINNTYLNSNIRNYVDLCHQGYEIKIIIHTAEFWSNELFNHYLNTYSCQSSLQFSIHLEIFSQDVFLSLANQHRYSILNEKDDFDLYIYHEDDMNVEHHHILSYLEASYRLEESSATIPSDFLVGFIRYEIIKPIQVEVKMEIDNEVSIQQDDKYRYLCDMPVQSFRLNCYNGIPYVVDEYNPHQAMWMLTKAQIRRLDSKCNFLHQQEIKLREYRGTRVYMSSFSIFKADPSVLNGVGIQQGISCNMIKVIPWKNFTSYGVHHMRQRYALNDEFGILAITLESVERQIRQYALNDENRKAGNILDCWMNI